MAVLKFLYTMLVISCILFFYLNIPKKLNKKIIEEIEEQGLSHITNIDNIKLMVDDDGYAFFKSSSRLKSCTNYFRKSVFFFMGQPSKKEYLYNITNFEKREKVLLRILPEDVDKKIFENLRWRKLDRTVIHIGDISLKAETWELNNK